MKVRVLSKFNDLKEGKIREVGEVFIVSKKRYEEIIGKGDFVEKIEEIKTNEDDEEKKGV